VHATPVYDLNGNFAGWQVSIHDVTRAKTLAQRFLQMQTLEVIEKLAGRVAHQFGDLLQLVNGYAELGLSRLDTSHPIYGHLVRIKEATQHGTALVQGLEAFGCQRALNARALNLNNLMLSLVTRLRRLLPESVGLSFELRAERSTVFADRAALEQVILNVVANACEAMPQGGTLALETSNVLPAEAYGQPHAWVTPREYVCVRVSDSGVGMDQVTLSRILEPFFTTKELGSGLGLPVVWGLVKQHDGHLEVSSQPEQGTTVRIYLLVLG
jgi:two-component system, cell cycle sensor histidine kinase and response regulator CckA